MYGFEIQYFKVITRKSADDKYADNKYKQLQINLKNIGKTTPGIEIQTLKNLPEKNN